MSSEPRVLLFTPRNLAPVISRCCSYEFEDAISEMDCIESIAPGPAFGPAFLDYFGRTVNKIGRGTRAVSALNPGVSKLEVAGRYPLFFAVCQFATDLTWLNAVRGWRERCDLAACWLEEIWARDLGRLRAHLQILSRFDYIFTNCRGSVEGLAAATGRPVLYQPPGVDCLRFHPGDPPVQRVIDVFNMGRRHPSTHQALLDLAQERGIFYLYDTFKGNIQVQSPSEHRLQLANLIKRSRYFIANKAKVTEAGETGEQQEVGFRFFEGAAGGALMIGDPPDVESFRENFDWPDAVIRLAYGSAKVTDLLAELDGQPERLARIRRDGIDRALRSFDWAHRWRAVLATLGMSIPAGLEARETRLRELASGSRSLY